MLIEKRNKIIKTLKEYVIISFGLFVNALGWTIFLIPSKVVGGGIMGVSTLVYYGTNFPVGLTFLIINALLILIAIKQLGSGFGVKTIFAILALSTFMSLLQQIIKTPIVNDKFMAAIIGGIITGASVGIVFAQGGSSGGTDIIAMIINKYRNISPGRIILYCDIIIISSSYFIFKSFETIVYGFVTMTVASYAIDMVLVGAKQSVQIFVFSKHNNEIADKIMIQIKRGVTMMDAKGWYTKEESPVLLVVAKKYEAQSILKLIKEIDSDAFISFTNVTGVFGKGFEKIKI